MLQLIELTKEWEEAFLDYQKAWGNELFIPDSARLIQHNFDEWLEENEAMKEEFFAHGRQLVTAHTYFLVDTEKKYIIGAINLRHELNQYLYQFGGHIGYGIRPEERGKGYCSKMLEMALPIFKETTKDTDYALITCNKGNEASAKAIIKCGGVLENELYNEDEKCTVLRYKISL